LKNILTFFTFLIILTLKMGGATVAAKKDTPRSCFTNGASTCQVEALVSVDEKGQMVLPKTIRDKANIQPGDKLVLIGWERDGQMCCITMVKADSLAGMVKGLLGSMMKDMITE
jgi:AbrB family looped-hinge helix DNA binding protein